MKWLFLVFHNIITAFKRKNGILKGNLKTDNIIKEVLELNKLYIGSRDSIHGIRFKKFQIS